MNNIKVYPIGTEIKIKTYCDKPKCGVISQILIDPEVSYKVVYWDSCRKEEWINEFEIDYQGGNYEKMREIGFHL